MESQRSARLSENKTRRSAVPVSVTLGVFAAFIVFGILFSVCGGACSYYMVKVLSWLRFVT